MFNLSGSEIVVILLLALVVLGPEKLPDAIRRFGRTYGELKRMSSSFQEEMRSTIEEPMREMRETANLLRDQADFTRYTDEKPTSGNPMEAGVAAAAVQTPDVDDDDDHEPEVAADFDDLDDEFDHEFDDIDNDVIDDDEFDDEVVADDDFDDADDDADDDDEFDHEFDEEPTLLGEGDEGDDEAATGEDVADENASERDDGGHSSA